MSLRGYVSMGTGPDTDLVLHFTAGPTDVLNDPRVDTLLGFFPVLELPDHGKCELGIQSSFGGIDPAGGEIGNR